jgi:hypothetical protein
MANIGGRVKKKGDSGGHQEIPYQQITIPAYHAFTRTA